MHLKLLTRSGIGRRLFEGAVVFGALTLSLILAKHGIDETARGVRNELSAALPDSITENVPLLDTSAPPKPAVYPGPESLPKSIPVRNAEQLRADIRQTQTIEGAAALDLTDTIVLGRLLAIDDMLEGITNHYGTDYLWSLAMMMAESNLDPSAQGPLVDDRGLGQIGYEIELVGKVWGTDRTSPYYSAAIDPDATVWNPNANMHYQAIWFRNILTFSYVTSIEQTYALYTKGISSVDPASGVISERAQVDVRRAKGHVPRLEKLLFLKDYVRQQGAVPAAVPPVAKAILEIDRTTEDGAPAYTAFRDMYLDLASNGNATPAATSAYLHEAVSYTVELDRGYHIDPAEALLQIKAVMDRRSGFVKTDGSVVAAFNKDYTAVTERLAAANPNANN